MRLVRRETRPRLGVEPDDLLPAEIGDGLVQGLPWRLDDYDGAGEGDKIQLLYFLGGYGDPVHISIQLHEIVSVAGSIPDSDIIP